MIVKICQHDGDGYYKTWFYGEVVKVSFSKNTLADSKKPISDDINSDPDCWLVNEKVLEHDRTYWTINIRYDRGDEFSIVTNEHIYLMNNAGKTVERVW